MGQAYDWSTAGADRRAAALQAARLSRGQQHLPLAPSADLEAQLKRLLLRRTEVGSRDRCPPPAG